MSSAALTTQNLPQFREILEKWGAKQKPELEFTSTLPDPNDPERLIGKKQSVDAVEGKDVVVVLRTRPPLENEAADKFGPALEAAGPEDQAETTEENGPVEFCRGISVVRAEPGTFVAHVPGMKWNGPTLQHKNFDADLGIGPDVSNEEVYRRTVTANDLLPLVVSGGVGCILAYGQTGTGKTFTMEGLEERIARDLFNVTSTIGARFAAAERRSADAPAVADEDVFELSVTFLELLGRKAVDLVETPDEFDAEGNPVRKEVAVQEDKLGDVRPRLISTAVKSPEALAKLITDSLSHRRTIATLRNAQSSRSHALLTIRIKNTLLPYSDEGQLILVDLAGSERYEDSKAHDRARMDEAKENNKSLMNLKECVRAKAKMASEQGFVHIPWRGNKLTMLLKPIFDVESRQPSKTIIIAHVSPHIQDSVHSVNTLGYAAPFLTAPPKLRGPAPFDPTDPRTWDHAHTTAWFADQFTKRERKRKEAQWKVQEKKAIGLGKKIKPFDPEDLGEPRVDIGKLCPEPMTAKHFAKMYTVEIIEAVIAAANPWTLQGPELGVLKMQAAETAGTLFNLVIVAKTKSRNEIMRSRKRLNIAEVYGDKPVGRNLELPEEEQDDWYAKWLDKPENAEKAYGKAGNFKVHVEEPPTDLKPGLDADAAVQA